MLTLSGKSVLAIAAVWYTLKALLTTAIAGVSMAAVEGVDDPAFLNRELALKVAAPACTYLVGGVILAWETWRNENTAAINLALRSVFLFHVGMIAAYLVYGALIAPLAPQLLSYYASPGAQLVRFIAAILPFLLLAVVLSVWAQSRILMSRA